MHVVILGSKGFPRIPGAGGVERGVEQVSVRLAGYGHRVVVYERGERFTSRMEKGVTIRTVPYLDSETLAGWSHVLLSIVDLLRRRAPVDLVVVHCSQHGLFCPLLRLAGMRVVFHVHGREWRASKWSRFMGGLIFLSGLLGILGAHAVATVCRPSLASFRRWLPQASAKVALIPNGVPGPSDAERLARGAAVPGAAALPDLTEPFLLFVGRLVPQKRIDLLLRALAELPAGMRLLVAGSPSHCRSHVQELQRLAREAGPDRVVWLGHLDFATVTELYRRSAAVVLPSEAEGCSNVLLEALANGCCVVSSDIPENRAVLGDAAVFFRTGDLGSLVAGLRRLVDDPGERERLCLAAAARARSLWSWDQVADELLRLCQDESVTSLCASLREP